MLDKDPPLITVVIPTYNHADFLKRALTSIVSQDYSCWEVIVIDNHSKDNTDEVVRSFENPKIKLLKIHNNGVIAASRNLGISQSSGEWIAFMDSDDIWYKSRLSVCAKFFTDQNNEFDVISTDEIMVSNVGNAKKILRHGPASNNLYRDMILYGNRLSPSATIVRKLFLNQNNLRFSEELKFVSAEDYDFWLRLALQKSSFLFLSSIEGEYTIHSGNTSSQIDKHITAIKCVLKKHVFELQEFQSDKAQLWRKVKSRIYISHALKRLKKLELLKAVRLFFIAVTLSPFGLAEFIWNRIRYK